MVERWTQQRRREHTRDLLLDAAEEIFALRGFEGASLEEIAEAAGYTRGAIYKHFGGKEELFLAAHERFNEGFLKEFLDLIDPNAPLAELDLPTIAKLWHDMQSRDPRQYALATEFNLYVLRNPEIRQRVADERRRVAEMIATFIDEQAARTGASLRFPALTLARIALAASAGLEMAGYIDATEDDLYTPFLQLLMSGWDEPPPPAPPKRPARTRGTATTPQR